MSGCSSQLSDGDTSSEESSHLLVENQGGIKSILMYGETHSKFFIKNKAQYNPCIIYSGCHQGAFFSDVNATFSIGDKTIEVIPNSSWAFNDSFTQTSLANILTHYDSVIDTDQIGDWIQWSMPFGPIYSKIEGLGDISNLELRDRLIVLDSLRAFDNMIIDSNSYKLGWELNGVGVENETISVGQSDRYEEYMKSNLSFKEVEERISRKHKIALMEAQFRFEHRLKTEMINAANHTADTSHLTVTGFVLSAASCYCDFNSAPSCKPKCCPDSIKKALGDYLQDQFHVRCFQSGKTQLNTSEARNSTCKGTDRSSNWVNNNLGCVGRKSKADKLCSIAGGNMYVTKNILFLGANELRRIDTAPKGDSSLKALTELDKESINKQLLKDVYGLTKNKNVIWVGTKDLVNSHTSESSTSKSYQPIYHIDLFFYPLGKLSKEKPLNFYYLIAKPEVFGKEPNRGTEIHHLDSVMEVVAKAIYDSLTKLKLNPVPIQVPMGISYNIDGPFLVNMFYAFSNGLFERRNDSLRFLYSDFDVATASIPQYEDLIWRFEDCIRKGLKQDINLPLELIPVYSNSYRPNSGLRCQVKVLSRQ
ncbi:MAG: hypothetical protein ACI9FU_002093 [Granulosicoccus sp.]|jgi:hypothetical protein